MAGPTRYPFTELRKMMRARGDTVLDFAFGSHQPQPPPELAALVKANPQAAFHRGSPAETRDLETQAAAMLADVYGVEVAPECILPAPGGRAAIDALIATTLEPGAAVLVTEPGYPTFARIANRRGASVVAAWLDPASGFAPDVEAVAGLAGTCRLAALNYPNNPTGAVLTDTVAKAVGSALPADAIIFNDATYGPLSHDRRPHSLLTPGLVRHEVVELHSVAKMFGLDGLPVSFLAGSPKLIARVREYAEFAWAPPSAMQIRVCMHCLADTGRLREVQRNLSTRIDRLHATLTDLDFKPYPTHGGQYVLCPVTAGIGGRVVDDPWDATRELLDRFGVAVMPWDAEPHGYLRFAALYRDSDLTALEALGAQTQLVSA